jgi:hypothetical protein
MGRVPYLHEGRFQKNLIKRSCHASKYRRTMASIAVAVADIRNGVLRRLSSTRSRAPAAVSARSMIYLGWEESVPIQRSNQHALTTTKRSLTQR